MTTATIYLASCSIIASFGLLLYIFAPRRKPRIVPTQSVSPFRQRKLSVSPLERVLMPLLLTFAHYSKKLTPAGFTKSTAEKLILSGMATKITIEVLLGIKLICGLLFGVLAFLLAPLEIFLAKIVATVIIGFIGFLLPDIRISRSSTKSYPFRSS